MDRSTIKAIIPAAGLGSRLLSVTKEQPKEMLPVFSNGLKGDLTMKPVVQLIFEQLFDFGVRDFCFIVGRGKRAIEDHFTPDEPFVGLLRTKRKEAQAAQLSNFYRQVKSSSTVWMNQPSPLGFGHAVFMAKTFAGGGDVVVHAGDTQIISPHNGHLERMLKAKSETNAEAVLLLKEVADPRQFGIAQVRTKQGYLVVDQVVEKPEKPRGRLAIMPIYIFSHKIFDALQAISKGKGGEIQLTDGIQKLIDTGYDVRAITVKQGEHWLDVGTPETYWQALKSSRELYSRDS